MKPWRWITTLTRRRIAALGLYMALAFLTHDLAMAAPATGHHLAPAAHGTVEVSGSVVHIASASSDHEAHSATARQPAEEAPSGSPCDIGWTAVLGDMRPLPSIALATLLALTLVALGIGAVLRARMGAAPLPSARDRLIRFQVLLI